MITQARVNKEKKSSRKYFMKDIALIDADIVCYRVGFTTQNDPKEIAEVRTDELIRRIVHDVEAKTYKCPLSGTDNFRYNIYPEYKGNRKDVPRPIHLDSIREHLCRYHAGSICVGEADDELSIEQHAFGDRSIICSIDKDFLQVPGWHYNFVTGVTRFVSPFDGLRNFYAQVITGDGADNIPSFDGKVRNQIPKFIQRLVAPLSDMTEETEMYSYVRNVYEDHSGNPFGWKHIEEVLHRNAKLLYLSKKEGDFWNPPNTN